MMKKTKFDQGHKANQVSKEQQGTPFTPLFDGKLPNYRFLSVDDKGNLTVENISSNHPVGSSRTPKNGLLSMIEYLGSFIIEKCRELREKSEKLEVIEAYLNIAEMCQKIKNDIENWSSRNSGRAIDDGLVHEFYELLMGCFFLGSFNCLVSVEEYLPNGAMQSLLSGFEDFKRAQDEHAAQSSAEHQKQINKATEHDSKTVSEQRKNRRIFESINEQKRKELPGYVTAGIIAKALCEALGKTKVNENSAKVRISKKLSESELQYRLGKGKVNAKYYRHDEKLRDQIWDYCKSSMIIGELTEEDKGAVTQELYSLSVKLRQ